jgi:hypothetical protein
MISRTRPEEPDGLCCACSKLRMVGKGVPRTLSFAGRTPGGVAIAWTLRLPAVTGAIVVRGFSFHRIHTLA